MDHMNPEIIDQVLAFGNPKGLLLFLLDSMFSTSTGYFRDVPTALSSLGKGDTLQLQELEIHILQPYTPRIAGFISRVVVQVPDPLVLLHALEMYLPPPSRLM
jgi:hypothetical protein